MKALVYKDETMGADYDVEEIPADMLADAKAYHEKLVEKVSEADDKLLEKYLGGETDHRRRAEGGAAQALHRVGAQGRGAVRAGHLRHRVQEQGRPADARRGRRLPAVAARYSAGHRHRPRREGRETRSSARPTTRSRSRRWRSRS